MEQVFEQSVEQPAISCTMKLLWRHLIAMEWWTYNNEVYSSSSCFEQLLE